jgi:SAM-dependent methyltransferase
MSAELLAGHLAAIRCPACESELISEPGGVECRRCAARFAYRGNCLDLAPNRKLPDLSGLGPLFLQDPLQITRYEDLTRPAFLRVAAANWAADFTPEQEMAYLRDHASAAEGPVLDVACGAGRWTRVLMEKFGSRRVIGLDLSDAMLDAIGRALPGILTIRASAMWLPFGNSTLGAVNCFAALQIMPDPAHVIAEIGRCLQPGGIFTLGTLTPAPRPIQRYFQRRQEEVFSTRSFEPSDLVAWIHSAGMRIVHQITPASFLFLTAERAGA